MLGLQFSANREHRYTVRTYMYMCVCVCVFSGLSSRAESKSQGDRICNVNSGDTQTKVQPETVTRFDIEQMYKYSDLSSVPSSLEGNSKGVQ